MFTCKLIACHIMMKNACFELLRDDRGPYETEKRCEERIDEMLDTIKVWLKFQSPIAVTGWKCSSNASSNLNVGLRHKTNMGRRP